MKLLNSDLINPKGIRINALISLISIFWLIPLSANADQFFGFGEPATNYGPSNGPITFYNDGASGLGVEQIFGADECKIIKEITLEGIIIDNKNNKLKTTALSQVEPKLPVPYKLLGYNNAPVPFKGYGTYNGVLIVKLKPNPLREDGKWDISGIKVNAINLMQIEDPKLNISGEDFSLPVAMEYKMLEKEFAEGDLIDSFTLSVSTGCPVAFREIRMELREPTSFPEDSELKDGLPASADNRYTLPALSIGGVSLTENSQCLIYKLPDVEEIASANFDAAQNNFSVEIPEAGEYGVAYKLNSSFYGLQPQYEVSPSTLIPLTIRKDISSIVNISSSGKNDNVRAVITGNCPGVKYYQIAGSLIEYKDVASGTIMIAKLPDGEVLKFVKP